MNKPEELLPPDTYRILSNALRNVGYTVTVLENQLQIVGLHKHEDLRKLREALDALRAEITSRKP